MQSHLEVDDPGIATIIGRFEGLEGPLLPMLHAIQAERGHVPAHAIPLLAHALNLSRAEVHGIVSFYHDFRHEPAGSVVLRLCRAEACQSRGAEAVAEHARRRLGIGWHGTTADGRVTLEPVFCLGLCAAAPCGMVGDRPMARLDAAAIDAVLEAVQ